MARRFEGGKLVVATHNAGKLTEIGELLAPFGVEALSAGALGLPEPVEDGDSYNANARIKSHAAAQASGLPALADDSGLSVSALNGAPGIYSARWAGPLRDFGAAMALVQEKLGDAQDRSAQFICALSLAWPDGHDENFEGVAPGHLTWPPRGDHGFGYDPIFIPEGHARTFAQMPPDEKHGMSHRAKAFKMLVAACFKPD